MSTPNTFLRGNVWYTHFRYGRRRYSQSLETSNHEIAKQRARQMYADVVNSRWESLDARKMRQDYNTIGELVKCYDEGALTIREHTRTSNISALRRMIHEVYRTPAGISLEERNAQIDAMTVDKINEHLALEFQQMRLKAAGSEALKKTRAIVSANAVLRKARSLFCGRAMLLYKKIKLGDVDSFMKVLLLNEGTRKWRAPARETIEAILKAADELKKTNPRLHLVFGHFSRLGLRNKEIEAARLSWIEKRPVVIRTVNGTEIREQEGYWITTREDFKPKGREGFVPIPDDLLEEIRNIERSAIDDHVIPAKNSTERRDLIYRDHSTFARQFFPDRTKSSYELRKYVGSAFVMREGNVRAGQEILRHANASTTDNYYLDSLNPLRPLERKDLLLGAPEKMTTTP